MKLSTASDFATKVVEALKLMDKAREVKWSGQKSEAEGQLYDKLPENNDKFKLPQAREAGEKPAFSDKRLEAIWPRFKARNYPEKLSSEESAEWENYCRQKLTSGGESSQLAAYFQKLGTLKSSNLSKNQEFLLEELALWGQSLMPSDGAE